MNEPRKQQKALEQLDSRGCQVSFRVHYYETDMMGIVHHSNYLRWFETARTEYLRQVDMTYRSLEESGLGCPLIGASCRFLHSCTYDDTVTVQTWIGHYDGLRLFMTYRVFVNGQVICTGETEHAFVFHGRAVALQRSLPGIHTKMMAAFKQDHQPAGNPARPPDDPTQPSEGLALA
jgi:acyl-CoA thioester hydrolase